MEMIEYPKIPGPFKRHVAGPEKNKVIPWEWASPELEYLSDNQWFFTEKVDGTNIRVIWDGHRPTFAGRTNYAQIPAKLMTALHDMFPEELFEQKFGSDKVILFGEGYGAGIQKGGGNYRKDNSFILFDVKIGDWWLTRTSVEDIADSLGINVVPIRFANTLIDAILTMADVKLFSTVTEKVATYTDIATLPESLHLAEGMVGMPVVPMSNRKGERVIVKLKGCDLYGLDI